MKVVVVVIAIGRHHRHQMELPYKLSRLTEGEPIDGTVERRVASIHDQSGRDMLRTQYRDSNGISQRRKDKPAGRRQLMRVQ